MKFISLIAAIATVNADFNDSAPRCDFDLSEAFGYPWCGHTRHITQDLSPNTLHDNIRTIKNDAEEYAKKYPGKTVGYVAYFKLKPGVDVNDVRCDFRVLKANKYPGANGIRIGNTKKQESYMYDNKYWGNYMMIKPGF